jgi:hypothetical protein
VVAEEIMQRYLHGGHGRRPEWLRQCIEEAVEKLLGKKKGKPEDKR